MRKIFTILFVLVWHGINGQTGADSLLASIDNDQKVTNEVEHIFKSPRIIMAHSVEMLPEGVMDFRILHRFGTVKTGINEMFGLDNASMRMSFDYGITKNFTVGIGRSTNLKELDYFVKGNIIRQRKGEKNIPLSVVAVLGGGYITIKDATLTSSKRNSMYAQLLIGSKINDKISLQVTPTFLSRGLTYFSDDDKTVFALGIGGRLKLSRRVHFLVDYVPALSGVSKQFVSPLSVGVDIETGGHVFQLHFSNAVGMYERAYIVSTSQEWPSAEVSFGFNLSRVFQLKKNTATW
jgi:hypothetical protein